MKKPIGNLHGQRPRVGQLPIEEDVRRELESHIRMCAKDLEALGWEPAEAAREAQRRFGDMTELRRECGKITRQTDRAEVRAGRLDALAQDLKYGVRVLFRSPAFAALAVLTIALGIGANTAIFSLVYGVLLRPLPYPESEQIVSVREHQSVEGRTMSVAAQNFRDWRTSARSVESLSAYQLGNSTIRGGDRPFRTTVATVTEDFGAVFRIVPTTGRLLGPGDFGEGTEPVALVSERLWASELGGKPLAEIRIEISGARHRVVGVVPSDFDFPRGAQIWRPLFDENTSRSAHNYSVVGRLAGQASVAQADTELDGIQQRITQADFAEDPEFVADGVMIQPLREFIAGRSGGPLGLLFAAAGLVLLIACTNLASTLLARGSFRLRELNVRQAVGASPGRLKRQLLTESCLLAVLGGVVGLGLAKALITAVKATDGVGIPRLQEVTLDLWALAFAAFASLLTGLLFGLLPAVRLSSEDPGAALRSGDRSQGQSHRSNIWGPLVAAEVALAFVLLSGSLLLVKSFQRVMTAERGFTSVGVMTADIDLDPARYTEDTGHIQFYQGLLSDLEVRPTVEAAGVVTSVPLSGSMPNGRLELDGDLTKHATAHYAVASGGYFPAIGIPLLQGRLFDSRDRAETAHVAIVSKSFAERYWPGEEPIGRQVTGGGMDEFWETRDFAEVVGVVGDARYLQLARETGPVVYFPFSQRPRRMTYGGTLVARSSPSTDLAGTLRAALDAHDPSVPPRFMSMDERIRSSVAERRFLVSLLGGFALVALVLSGLGIYGVVSFSVARRTREMGIRMALGGGRSQIRRMVQLQSLRAVLAGGVMGLVAATLLGRVIESRLFQVSTRDPLTLMFTTLVLLATAWLATWIPAIRSTRVDPLTAMKLD